MVKLTIKLALVGLILNALYQVVPSFYTHWKFTDAIKELATYPGFRATNETVLVKCEKIAKEHGLALKQADFDVRLAAPNSGTFTTIDVSYEVVLKPVPGKPMTHLFALHAVGDAPRFGALTP